MKQNYSFIKLFMLTVMALFAGNAMAEDIIWQEDFSSYSDGDVPNGGTYSYVCEGTTYEDDGSVKGGTKIYGNQSTAGGTAPELLIAKNIGSFQATVALGGRTGDMNLQFKTNRSDLKVEVTGATLGEKTRSGNTDTYPLTGASGTLTIKFYMSTSSNARLDDIKLYQGTAKKPAGLSWGKASAYVTFGKTEEYEKYIPTLQNPNGLSVSCTSSDESVATVSSQGVITVVGVGKTTITATFAGNGEYEEQSVSIDVSVNEASSETPASEITVAQALEIINGLEDGKTTSETYTVKGFVVGTPDFQRKDNGSLYGNVNMEIAETKGGSPTLTIYRGKGFDNKDFTEEDVAAPIMKEGDEVVFTGKLQKYKKGDVITPELTNGYLISVNGSSASVNGIEAAKSQNAPAYNVAGQRVKDGFRGIQIQNGRKVLK